MSTTNMAIIHRAGPARILSLEEVGMFLRAQNSRGIVHLMRSLTEPAHQVAVAATLMSMSANGSNASATLEAAPDKVEKAEKAKKVMNAFVGFRCKFHNFSLTVNYSDLSYRLLHHYARIQAVADEVALKSRQSAVGARA